VYKQLLVVYTKHYTSAFVSVDFYSHMIVHSLSYNVYIKMYQVLESLYLNILYICFSYKSHIPWKIFEM